MPTDDKNLKLTAYIIMGVASIGLIFFIVNWIRCRMSRTHLQEYDLEDTNKLHP